MTFDNSRLRRADQIVGGGALALFIFMFFFKWFGGSVSGALPTGASSAISSSATGWQTFTNSRWIWLITIVVALASVVMVVAEKKLDAPVQLGLVVTGLGALSSLLILYRIVHHPSASASFGGFHASYGIKIGIWLGFISALAITYGGYLQARAEQEAASPGASSGDASAFSGVTVTGDEGGSQPSSAASERPANRPSPTSDAAPSTPTPPAPQDAP